MTKKPSKNTDQIQIKVLAKALSERVDSVPNKEYDQEQTKQDQIDRNTVYAKLVEQDKLAGEKKAQLPFAKLKSFQSTAITLSYLGFSDEIESLLK